MHSIRLSSMKESCKLHPISSHFFFIIQTHFPKTLATSPAYGYRSRLQKDNKLPYEDSSVVYKYLSQLLSLSTIIQREQNKLLHTIHGAEETCLQTVNTEQLTNSSAHTLACFRVTYVYAHTLSFPLHQCSIITWKA